MKEQSWKDRLGVMYSTNPDYKYDQGEESEEETLPKEKQSLRIEIDRRNRSGKTVTLVSGFVGTTEDLETLAKLLKKRCGVGGSAKEGNILIQGDVRQKLSDILLKEGYKKIRVI